MATAYASGTPCWADTISSDFDAAARFYTGLLGWGAAVSDHRELGRYANLTAHGTPVAGLMPAQEGNPYSDVWSLYIAVDDVDATVSRAEESGGSVILPPMPVGEQGTVAMFTDPAGGVIGAWQAGTLAGFDRSGRPGLPAWFETRTPQYAQCIDFYRAVFGWDVAVVADDGRFRYSTFSLPGGETVAGIMDADAASEPARHWTVYFSVNDCDAAAARCRNLGGEVDAEPADSPFGRLAHMRDTTGTRFVLIARGA